MTEWPKAGMTATYVLYLRRVAASANAEDTATILYLSTTLVRDRDHAWSSDSRLGLVHGG